ncbi:hypothetical protein B0O79_2838 [Flavobacteriaceae bacterium MAR_2009_75]|nr:hypothetical protein B0O79_2838 [Flavobacteriaceae bacterium MAR_2009_75]
MEKTSMVLLAIALFAAITFLVWKLSHGRYKREFGEKRRKIWGQQTFYWEGVIGISTGLTFLVLFLLKWTNALIF